MNAVQIQHQHHCNRCDYSWKGRRGVERPRVCPHCLSTRWALPKTPEEPGFVKRFADGTAETKKQTVSRLVKAATDILLTNPYCAIGRDRDGKYQALTPLLHRSWLQLPAHYGDILFCLNRYISVTADGLGRHLFKGEWEPST